MTPEESYYFAKNNPGCDIDKYQKIACNDPEWAYLFSKWIPEADIEYCYEFMREYRKDKVRKFILGDL